MLKAQRSVIMFFMIMMPLCFFAGASVASADCDEGPSSAGPTVTENFTPLPDPTLVTSTAFVVLQADNKFVVWDPKNNSAAFIRNAADTGWVSFPCALSDIEHWMNTTTAVSTSQIYNWTEAGDDIGLVYECDGGMSANTGCGSLIACTLTDSSPGCYDISQSGDEYHCELNIKVEYPASLWPGKSYDLDILTSSGGRTCFRNILEFNREFYQHIVFSPEQDEWTREEYILKIYTPIGTYDAVTLMNYGICSECVSGTSICNTTRRIDLLNSITDLHMAYYSNNVMLQIYFTQYRIKQDEMNYLYNCGGIGGHNTTTTYLVEKPKFIAACDYYANSNATDQDPTTQARNSGFESAIQTLLDAGSPDTMLGLSATIRKTN